MKADTSDTVFPLLIVWKKNIVSLIKYGLKVTLNKENVKMGYYFTVAMSHSLVKEEVIKYKRC